MKFEEFLCQQDLHNHKRNQSWHMFLTNGPDIHFLIMLYASHGSQAYFIFPKMAIRFIGKAVSEHQFPL